MDHIKLKGFLSCKTLVIDLFDRSFSLKCHGGQQNTYLNVKTNIVQTGTCFKVIKGVNLFGVTFATSWDPFGSCIISGFMVSGFFKSGLAILKIFLRLMTNFC